MLFPIEIISWKTQCYKTKAISLPFQLYWLSREGLYCYTVCTYILPVAIFYFLLYGCNNSYHANISNYPQQDIFHPSRFLKYKYTDKIRLSLIHTVYDLHKNCVWVCSWNLKQDNCPPFSSLYPYSKWSYSKWAFQSNPIQAMLNGFHFWIQKIKTMIPTTKTNKSTQDLFLLRIYVLISVPKMA